MLRICFFLNQIFFLIFTPGHFQSCTQINSSLNSNVGYIMHNICTYVCMMFGRWLAGMANNHHILNTIPSLFICLFYLQHSSIIIGVI